MQPGQAVRKSNLEDVLKKKAHLKAR